MSRYQSLIIVASAYTATFILGLFLTLYLPEGNSLSKLFLIDVFLTLFIFMFSFRFGNASIYTPYWSVIPAYMIAYWWYNSMAIPNYMVWGITTFLVLAWAVGLVYNWVKNWQDMQQQDWRHQLYQDKTGKWYLMVNFVGIHMLPTLLVWVACIPLAYIFTSNEAFTWVNWLGVAIAVIGIYFEIVSDWQLRKFKTSASSKDIFSGGLWNQIRHPNYLGEIVFWWGMYIMSINAFTPWYAASGAVGITLMFLFVSIPMMDKHLLQTRPSYAGYMLKVGGLLPKLKN